MAKAAKPFQALLLLGYTIVIMAALVQGQHM